MTELFDSYRSNYRDVVQSSIDFSGLPHSFFMRAKADLLRELIAPRLGPSKPVPGPHLVLTTSPNAVVEPMATQAERDSTRPQAARN